MKPSERFTNRARDYSVGRPSYPVEAIDAIFEGLPDVGQLTVVDLGAGTGIASELLADRGARVVAVEPNAAMREQGARLANVSWLARDAEDTRLGDGTADVVTAFQAFHWFDYGRALSEMTRILRPGGRAVLVYNQRDDGDPFTASYGKLVRRHATDGSDVCARRNTDGITAFRTHHSWKSVRTVTTSNLQQLSRTALKARALSTSYVPNEGSARATFLAELDALFDEYATDSTVVMRMNITVVIAST